MIIYLWGWITVFTIALSLCLYRILIHPYLQYRYYQRQAEQKPNLLIDMPPRFVPFFGDLIRLSAAIKQHDDPFVLLREAIKSRARFSIGFMGWIVRIAILDVDVIQDLLSASKFDWTGLSPISTIIFGMMFPRSLIAMEGIEWQQRRPMLGPVFRYAMMRTYAEAISEVTQRNLDQLQKQMPDQIDFAALFKRWTISVIGTCAFGGAFTGRFDDGDDRRLTDEAIQSLSDVLDISVEFVMNPVNLMPAMSWLPTPRRLKFRSAVRRCRAVADEVVRRRLRGESPAIQCERDLLDVLLSYKSEQTGKSLSLDDIRDECLLFIFAGHETTSNLLSWLFVVFYQYPHIHEQCREEVLNVLKSNQSTIPSESDIKLMPFLHSCLLETLRLYPPAPVIGRQTRRPFDLAGLHVPAGTYLRVDIWAIHHSPRYWKDPETFDPNRFLRRDDNGALSVRHPPEIHSHAFLPFGHGIRSCPGQAFALLEARLIMAALLARFQVQFSPGQRFPQKIRITSSPSYGIIGRLIPHSDQSQDSK